VRRTFLTRLAQDESGPAAIEYGLIAAPITVVTVPSEAELVAWGLAVGGFPSPRTEPQEERALVAGTLYFDVTKPGWVGSRQMRWRGADYALGDQRCELRRSVPLPDAWRSARCLGSRRPQLRRRCRLSVTSNVGSWAVVAPARTCVRIFPISRPSRAKLALRKCATNSHSTCSVA
jgi:Flp pilus assembly pilin Flp